MPDRTNLPRRPVPVSGTEFRSVLIILILAACTGALVAYPLTPKVSLELNAAGEEFATWFAERLEGLIWEFFNLVTLST